MSTDRLLALWIAWQVAGLELALEMLSLPPERQMATVPRERPKLRLVTEEDAS